MSSGLREVAVSGWRTKSARVDRKLCVCVCVLGEIFHNNNIKSNQLTACVANYHIIMCTILPY